MSSGMLLGKIAACVPQDAAGGLGAAAAGLRATEQGRCSFTEEK